MPDYRVPRGSEGWATYQKLGNCGWTLISSDRAYRSTKRVMENFSS
ncbi:hypothetical protein [Myxosarcina sp. GI1(2024)]